MDDCYNCEYDRKNSIVRNDGDKIYLRCYYCKEELDIYDSVEIINKKDEPITIISELEKIKIIPNKEKEGLFTYNTYIIINMFCEHCKKIISLSVNNNYGQELILHMK